MDAPTLILLLLGVGALAMGLDAILVVGWRRRREGKPFFHPRLSGWLSGLGFLRRRATAAGVALWGELRALAVDIRRDELKLLRTALVLGCLGFSASLGYANLHSDMVATWLPLAYLVCFVVAAAALAPPTGPRLTLNRSDLLVLIPVGLAVIVRVLFLETIPSGLHTDEVTTANFTLHYIYPSTGITFYPLRTGPDTQPALFYSLVRLSLGLFGYSIAALLAASVLAGTLAILTTYALVACWQDRQTALIAALLLSTYHYHVAWSRIALNNIWDTVWIPLILASLIWGWRRSWSGGALLSGLAIGLSQYFYVGSRVALFLVPYVLYRLWTEDRDPRKLLVHTAKMVAAAAVVALPLALFTAANPELVLDRARLNYTWIPEALSRYGNSGWAFLRMAAEQAWLAFAGLTVLPDRSAFYGPGIPFLFGLAALFFLAGLLWAVHRRQFLPLLWILATLFFADFLIPGPPHTSHVIGAVPALIWVVALPLRDLARLRSVRLAGALLVLLMLTDLVAYIAILGTGGGDPAFSVPFPPGPYP
jgi:hypothetical protein